MKISGLNSSAGLVVASMWLLFVLGCGPRGPDARFQPMTYVSPSGTTLPYRLFVPAPTDTGVRYSLVVFLHGGRGSGTDNVRQISASNYSGSHVWIRGDVQAKHPAFVVAPQIPELRRWDYVASDKLSTHGELAVELVQELEDTYPIDRDRIYITGQSLGGWGVWDLIAKRPDLFAAAVPVCGGGNPSKATSMRDVSIWTFHGARDRQVSVEQSREMVKALRNAGVRVEYTEYRFSDHAIWDKAYGEDGLIDWVFAQQRRR